MLNPKADIRGFELAWPTPLERGWVLRTSRRGGGSLRLVRRTQPDSRILSFQKASLA
jgi:hypothetical protein